VHNRGVDWDDVRVFLAIARLGRVSAAARQLGVEHTTVGRRLAALEDQLGVQLFYRTRSGYRLTPHGESVRPSAETMESAALSIDARAREASGEVSGRVRIALVDELASYWLAPRLPAFRAQHPALELQLLVGTTPLDLARGEAEIAVRSPRPRQAGLVAVRLARTGFALYASKQFARGKRLRVTANTKRRLPLLAYAREHHVLQSAAWFQPVFERGELVLTTNSSHALLAAARASAGIAVLPHMMARAYDELACVSDDVAVTEVWMVTHPEFRRDPKVRAVGEFLKNAGRDLR